MKIGRDDIYSAPVVAEAVPPTERTLLALLERDGRSAELLFSLANVYMRDARFEEAIERYKDALTFETYRLELTTNLGVALAALDRFDESLSSLRQAVLLDPTQMLPLLQSARIQLKLGDDDGALSSFERVSKLMPTSIEPQLAMAGIYERNGSSERALQLYEVVHEQSPDEATAKRRLAEAYFAHGREAFERGDHSDAFAVWSKAFHRFRPVFATDQELLAQFSRIIRSSIEAGGLKQELDLFRERLVQSPEDLSGVYRLLSYFLFTLGMIGECFEPQATLSEQGERWKKSLVDNGEHPYPHFRLGLIAALSGDLEKADAELRSAQDKLLPKKQATLKLSQLIKFVGELREMQKLAREGHVPSSPDWEWESAGFTNPFELKAWKGSGLPPPVARTWRDAGLSAAQARDWSKQKLSVDESSEWLRAGFRDAKQVKRWIRAGVPPAEAGSWAEHFGVNVESAIQCRSAGFQEPSVAAAWLKVVLLPWDAIRWHELGFSPEEADKWQSQGISDPHAALERKKVMGIDRAGDSTKKGPTST
ncbi:MAG: hypothetical protein U0136_15375 [Bdellovibrionota bacterium]